MALLLTPSAPRPALYQDETKILAHGPHSSSKPTIDVYSCAGKLLRSIPLEKGSSVRGIGWSDDERLLVVTRDGVVRCYVNLQGDFTQFSLGNGAEEYGVEACRQDSLLHGAGLVAVLTLVIASTTREWWRCSLTMP